MKKELGDVTLRELAEECVRNDDCRDCPMGHTKLNCWRAFKMLSEDDGHLLSEVVELWAWANL